MSISSPLSIHRLNYHPPLPRLLEELNDLVLLSLPRERVIDQKIHSLFPKSAQQSLISFAKGNYSSSSSLIVGVVFSGGQAPGGHNVISGLYDALKKMNPSSRLIGFLDGPSGILKNQSVELTEELIGSFRNQGGFHLIGSGRTKIETPDQFKEAENTARAHSLDGLIIIGGDDSNTNAAHLAEYFLQKGIKTSVIGVPKTIDGDLKNEFIEQSFGFDTAAKTYAGFIGNVCIDALSAKKYYFFIKMMGRTASHLTLEVALQTGVNLALIGEEIAEKQQTLQQVVDHVTDLIIERKSLGKNYGVILVPEGLLEFIPDCQTLLSEMNELVTTYDRTEVLNRLSPRARACFDVFPLEIQEQLFLDRDPHGNIQVSKIETERLFLALVKKNLENRSLRGFNPQPLFCGYEGRCALPSNFDANYCYALGHVAALLVKNRVTGYTACLKKLSESIDQWEPFGIPIVGMLHFEKRNGKELPVIRKALVDIKGQPFSSFVEARKGWRTEDFYYCPGPIQFEGPKELTESITKTLKNL